MYFPLRETQNVIGRSPLFVALGIRKCYDKKKETDRRFAQSFSDVNIHSSYLCTTGRVFHLYETIACLLTRRPEQQRTLKKLKAVQALCTSVSPPLFGSEPSTVMVSLQIIMPLRKRTVNQPSFCVNI